MAVHFQGLMDTPQSEKECWTDGKQSSGLGWDELMMRGFDFFTATTKLHLNSQGGLWRNLLNNL